MKECIMNSGLWVTKHCSFFQEKVCFHQAAWLNIEDNTQHRRSLYEMFYQITPILNKLETLFATCRDATQFCKKYLKKHINLGKMVLNRLKINKNAQILP